MSRDGAQWLRIGRGSRFQTTCVRSSRLQDGKTAIGSPYLIGETYPYDVPTNSSRWTRAVFLALIALLPLQTVFVRVEVALKPWLLLLALVVAADVISARGIPWPRRAGAGAGVFLLATLASWSGGSAGGAFWRLWLALLAGALLMLTVRRHALRFGEILRVVFWSGAALGITAIFISLLTNGAFGESAVTSLNEFPLVDRVNKEAYLSSGFVALTNWHQDPGYSALWTNVWLVLSSLAWVRGEIKAPKWVGPVVLGSLGTATFLTYSRTGWLGLAVAIGGLLISSWWSEELSFKQMLKTLSWAIGLSLVLVGSLLALDEPNVGGDITTALEFRLAYLTQLGFVDVGEVGVVDPNLVVPDNRVDVWAEYASRFLDSPVRGIGLGTGWAEPGLQEPHNMWIELVAETGVVGLMGFLFLLYTLGRPRGPEALTVLAVLLLASLTQTVLFEPVLWFGLGVWLTSSCSTATSKSGWALSAKETQETPSIRRSNP